MKYRIAELNIDLTASGRTAVQAAPYAFDWEGEADMTIRADGEKLLAEVPALETADMAEYMASGEYFALGLLHFDGMTTDEIRGVVQAFGRAAKLAKDAGFDGMMLHASAVELDGECVCFSAPPGVGKSTMTERWERLFGAAVLNDDKPALRHMDGKWIAFGTPWSGKHDKSRTAGAPLRAICFLFRGEENAVEPLTPG